MFWKLYSFSRRHHSITFKLQCPVAQNITVIWEHHCEWGITTIDDNNPNETVLSSNTLVPILVLRGVEPPIGSISCVHDYYLPDFEVYVAPFNPNGEWTTVTKIEDLSERLHDRDFPPPAQPRARSSSSSALARIFTVDDTLPKREPSFADASTASASRASASVSAPAPTSASASDPATSSASAPKRFCHSL